MQKFRKNLITPQLAATLLLNSAEPYRFLDFSSDDKGSTGIAFKTTAKKHTQEGKKLSRLLEGILRTEFQGEEENCIWDDVELNFSFYRERLIVVVEAEICVSCQSLFEEEQDNGSFIGVLTGHKIAFSIVSFLRSMNNEDLKIKMKNDHYEIKLEHYLWEEEEFKEHELLLDNASLEVKRS